MDGSPKPLEPTETTRFCERAIAALRRLAPVADHCIERLLRDAAHSTLSNPHMNEISVPDPTFAGSRIRKRGLALFAVGSILYVLAVFVMDRLRANGGGFHYVLLPAWIPLALACLGFVELVSGAPCYQLRRRWAELRGWQRAMIGVFLVVATLVAIICVASFLLILLS